MPARAMGTAMSVPPAFGGCKHATTNTFVIQAMLAQPFFGCIAVWAALRTSTRICSLSMLSGDSNISLLYLGSHSTPCISARPCQARFRGHSPTDASSAIALTSSYADGSDFASSTNSVTAMDWIGCSMQSRTSPHANFLISGAIASRSPYACHSVNNADATTASLWCANSRNIYTSSPAPVLYRMSYSALSNSVSL